jgi:hypothetical protein
MLIVLSVCPACIPGSSGKAKEVRRELLAEAKKHPTRKRLCQIPSIGPIRALVLMGILQTPYRFRTKRQRDPRYADLVHRIGFLPQAQ